MPKVIIFSTTYPAYHPLAGSPTYFVDQFLNSLNRWTQADNKIEINADLISNIYFGNTLHCKHHTIRHGQRFKVGEFFSPCIWSGKPYFSKQITICSPVRIEQIYNIEYDGTVFYIEGILCQYPTFIRLFSNDGFLPQLNPVKAFKDWFTAPFKGQIICWNKDINY